MNKLKFVLLFLILSFLQLKAERNVVLIIADDLSGDYFGFFPSHQDTVDVPNLRKLANKGIVFTNLMSNPVCSSTRSSILTGRYGFRTGVGGIVGGAGGSNQLDTSEITIPKLLKLYNPNIAKADIGKWHLHQASPLTNLLNPLRLGYDHFEGPFIGQLPSFTNWVKFNDGISSTITTYATTENVNNAISWVKSQSNKQFFLWLAFNAPHEPLHLPPTNLHSISGLTGTQPDIKAKPKQYFKAMIQAMDHEIGRLFDSLQVMNKLDSTDVIFIGDNGNTPKTAQIADTSKAKGTIYQYGVNVPMIISGPSVISGNRVSNSLVNTVDIYATVLDFFGDVNWKENIPSNKPVDSKSIFPIIRNLSSEIRPWQFCEIFKLIHDSDEGKAIRNLDFKLIKFDNGIEEFYNLKSDNLETNNLLLGKMDSISKFNYNYLCSEMTNLIGSGNICKDLTDVELVRAKSIVYPNPFKSKIYGTNQNDRYELIDELGNLISKGDNIQQKDFSDLPKGVYLLKLIEQNTENIHLQKVIKD